MKKCPFCFENIQDEAIKCRFCKEFLDKDSIKSSPKVIHPITHSSNNETNRLESEKASTPRNVDRPDILKGIKVITEKSRIDCWFCKKRKGDVKAYIDQPLYYILDRRMNLLGRIKTKYITTKIEVPRCQLCKERHDSLESRGCWLSIGVGMLFVLAYSLISNQMNKWGIGEYLWGLFLFEFFAFGTLMYIFNGKGKEDTKGFNYIEEFPPIKKLLNEDWHIGEKPPRKGPNVIRDNA